MRFNYLFIYLLAIVLGVFTGVLGSFFLLAIHQMNALLTFGFQAAGRHGWPLGMVSALTSMVMIYLAWWLVRHIAPDASGSGVPEIEGILMHRRKVVWRRLLPVKFVGGVLAIASKLVVGREGPTIQMGGHLGEMLGEWCGLSRHRRDALIAAGAAAGLATAFNAPLAGMLFVMEELRSSFRFSFTNFSMVAFCCVSAVIVLHFMLGAAPAIPMSVFTLPSLSSLVFFFLLGIVIGFMGWLFNVVLMKSLTAMDKQSMMTRRIWVVVLGLLVGYLTYRLPATVGGGYDIIETALVMRPEWSVLCYLIVVRFITTMLSYNVGAPGGIFAPMLALGTLAGLLVSYLFQWVTTDVTIHPGMFAVAGMGALFAAVVRAPVTGIVLVVEMTRNYSLILPLMVTCLTSTTILQLVGNGPIYSQLLRRILKKQERNE